MVKKKYPKDSFLSLSNPRGEEVNILSQLKDCGLHGCTSKIVVCDKLDVDGNKFVEIIHHSSICPDLPA